MAHPILVQIATFFRRLTPAQVVAMFLLVLTVTGFIMGLVYFMNRVEYVVLYANLSPEDANAVVVRLREQKVDFRLDDGGRTIRVPATRADELRVLLAGSGAPIGGGIGFEIFDKTNFGVTDFVQQVNYKRALEGELARTITGLSEVSQTRVHLVLPKETLFANEESEGKASVVVKLKMGQSLSQGAVQGIVNLIASSVEGIRPDSVTVLDAYGRMLSKPTSGDATEMLTDSQNRLKAEIEKQYSGKIISILEPIVGEGRVRANVAAELSLDKVEETQETYDPQSAVIRSQQKSNETTGPQAPGGPPGTQSNQPQGTTVATTTGPNSQNFLRTTETTNYEINKTVRHRIDPYGTVKKVTAAVIVDDQLKSTKDKRGAVQTAFVARSADDLKKYRDLVSAVIGIDAARGDLVTVENLSFGVRTEVTQIEEPSFLSTYSDYIIPVVKYLAFLLLFLLIYKLVLKPTGARVYRDVLGGSHQVDEMMLPAGASAEGLIEGHVRPQLPRRVGDIEAELDNELENELALPTKEARRGTVVKKKVTELVKKEPEAAAQMVKTWLAEDKRFKRRM